MTQPKPWLKMWREWIHDPKMLGLSLAEQGAWWRVVTLAQECDADGQLIKGSGVPLTLDEIATCIHISIAKDRKVFDSMLTKMHDQGSFHWDSKTLTITHFSERQELTPSASREAVRERVRRHREKQKKEAEQQVVTENSLPKNKKTKSGPPPLPSPTTTKEGEGEAEVEGNGVTAVTSKAILAEIAKLFEENFGIITPILSEKFKDFAKNYRGPVGWIKEAFAEAVTHNVRKWAYVEAILDRWQQEGREKASEQRPRQKRVNPVTYIRGSGEPQPEDKKDVP